MPDSTSVHEDDDILLGLLDEFHDLIEDKRLDIGIIGGRDGIKGSEETFRGNFYVNQIGGEHKIAWSALNGINCIREGNI